MITFAIAATLLALLVLVAVMLPLLRGGASAPSRELFDRAVYRDQIAELERDQARGLIAPGEADAARLEIQRRLLRAEGQIGQLVSYMSRAGVGMVRSILADQ